MWLNTGMWGDGGHGVGGMWGGTGIWGEGGCGGRYGQDCGVILSGNIGHRWMWARMWSEGGHGVVVHRNVG